MKLLQTKQTRRVYSVFFLALFLVLLFLTVFGRKGNYPVRLFLELDPLTALSTFLATGVVYGGLLLAVLTLLLTLVFGRFFCSWVCPLGTMNHWTSRLWPAGRKIDRINSNRYRSWYKYKYPLLFFLLVASTGGIMQIGLLDPIALTVRSFTAFVFPGLQRTSEGLSAAVFQAGFPLPQVRGMVMVIVGVLLGVGIVVALSRFLSSRFWRRAILVGGILLIILTALTAGGFPAYRLRPLFLGAWLIGGIFLLILALNRYLPRFWCRAICPLGALLGVVSRVSLLRIRRDRERCISCNLCLEGCQGACNPNDDFRVTECHVCFNCTAACPTGALSYGWAWEKDPATVASPEPNVNRRHILASVAAGAAAIPLIAASDTARAHAPSELIRPPGSLDEDAFLRRCIKCGACLRVCPTNVLQPSLTRAGLEGFWTPVADFTIGHCEHSCTLCTSVCPTGAIQPLPQEARLGKGAYEGQPIKLGTAFLDWGRCLPWAMATHCLVCEEVCPASPKAITISKVQNSSPSPKAHSASPPSPAASKGSKKLGRPVVNPDRCIGCGICENRCPVLGQKAIRVASVGETRSRSNRMSPPKQS